MKSLVFLLLFPSVVFAADLSANQFVSLGEPDPAAQAKLVAGCNDFPYLMSSDKEKCLALAKESHYTAEVVEACLKERISTVSCLTASRDSSVPASVISVCRKAMTGKGADNDLGACIHFFRESSSVFDEDAASFCLQKSPDFRHSRRCLNAIRDRDVDMDALKACASKSGMALLKEEVMDCVENATASAPLKTDAICTRKNLSRQQSGSASPGAR